MACKPPIDIVENFEKTSEYSDTEGKFAKQSKFSRKSSFSKVKLFAKAPNRLSKSKKLITNPNLYSRRKSFSQAITDVYDRAKVCFGFLLQENGAFLHLENGGKIKL